MDLEARADRAAGLEDRVVRGAKAAGVAGAVLRGTVERRADRDNSGADPGGFRKPRMAAEPYMPT